MRITKQGIHYISLIDDEEDYDIQDMMTEAMKAYRPFDFDRQIEVFVFYEERNDFEEYLSSTFSIIEHEEDEYRASHYPHGDKSIIGIEVSGLETTTLMTYALGRVIEYSRIRLDGEKGIARSKQPGYRYWAEFFAQSHASLNRSSGSFFPESPLREFTEMLPYKEDLFSENEMDITFPQMLSAISELMFHLRNNETAIVAKSLKELQEKTDETFIQWLRELFELLTGYMEKAGEFYTAPHDYTVFDKIEAYKKQMTNYFT